MKINLSLFFLLLGGLCSFSCLPAAPATSTAQTPARQEADRWQNPSLFKKELEKQLLQGHGLQSKEKFPQLIRDKSVRHKLAMWEFLNSFDTETLRDFASSPEKQALLTGLSRSPEALDALLYSGPLENPRQVLELIYTIHSADQGLLKNPLKTKIAVAIALEFARNPKASSETAADIYRFYTEKALGKTMDPGFCDLSPWATRLVCGALAAERSNLSLESLKWTHDNERGTAIDYYTKVHKTLPAFNPALNSEPSPYGKNGARHQKEFGATTCGAFIYCRGAAIGMGIPAVAFLEPGCASARIRINGVWSYLGQNENHKTGHTCLWTTWKGDATFPFLQLAQQIYDTEGKKTLQADQACSAGRLMASLGKEKEAETFYDQALTLQPFHYGLWKELMTGKGGKDALSEKRKKLFIQFEEEYPEAAQKLTAL